MSTNPKNNFCQELVAFIDESHLSLNDGIRQSINSRNEVVKLQLSTPQLALFAAYWSGLNSNASLDTLKMKLHAGYTDGHVESYGPSEVIPMEVIVDPSTGAPYLNGFGPGVFYLPDTSLH